MSLIKCPIAKIIFYIGLRDKLRDKYMQNKGKTKENNGKAMLSNKLIFIAFNLPLFSQSHNCWLF